MGYPRLGRVPTLPELFPSEELSTPSPSVEPIARKTERRRDQHRPLEPWERYRALNDAMDEAFEMMDQSNREARFALLVMGILNAFVVIGASRPEIVGSLGQKERIGAAALLGVYGVTAIYFLFQAVAALRPGRYQPDLKGWDERAADHPRGIRYFEDVIQRDVQSHWRAWCDVPLAQLNAELAVQHHSLCLKANVKRVAQTRLFAGLRVMVILVVCLMALFVYAVWVKVG